MPFTATVLTMFPEAFPGPLGVSLIGTAWRERGLWALETVDIRAFSTDKRGFLDDTPAGGGPGAVLKADVVARALDSVSGLGAAAFVHERPGSAPDPGARQGLGQGGRDHRPVRPVRGGGPAGARRPRVRGGLRRRRGPGRWRGGGDGGDRGVRTTDPRRSRPGREPVSPRASRTAFWSIRSTRDRGRSRGWRYPRSCCRATIKRSPQWREEQREETTRERRPDLWAAHLAQTTAGHDPAKSQVKGAKARGE